MAYLMLGIVMIFLSIVFRLAAVFRLTIPLLYALVVPTVFHEWYYANQTLANVIWYVLLAVVVLSWVVSLIRKVRGILLRRREDKMLELSITVCRYLDSGMIQCQRAGITVLCGYLHLRFQTLEDLLHIVGLTGQRFGLGDGLDVHPNLVLPRHVQQIIEAAIPLKILGGDLGGIICQG